MAKKPPTAVSLGNYFLMDFSEFDDLKFEQHTFSKLCVTENAYDAYNRQSFCSDSFVVVKNFFLIDSTETLTLDLSCNYCGPADSRKYRLCKKVPSDLVKKVKTYIEWIASCKLQPISCVIRKMDRGCYDILRGDNFLSYNSFFAILTLPSSSSLADKSSVPVGIGGSSHFVDEEGEIVVSYETCYNSLACAYIAENKISFYTDLVKEVTHGDSYLQAIFEFSAIKLPG